MAADGGHGGGSAELDGSGQRTWWHEQGDDAEGEWARQRWCSNDDAKEWSAHLGTGRPDACVEALPFIKVLLSFMFHVRYMPEHGRP